MRQMNYIKERFIMHGIVSCFIMDNNGYNFGIGLLQ